MRVTLYMVVAMFFSVMQSSNVLASDLFSSEKGNNQDEVGTVVTPITQEKAATVGEEFTIILDVNRTTGYDWRISYFPEMIQLTNFTVKPPKSPEGRPIMGAPGQAHFTFKLLASFPTMVNFLYERPQIGGDIAKIIVYTISSK